MGWRELLQTSGETTISPWVGGRALRQDERTWAIVERLPVEHGWFTFRLSGRKATIAGPAEPNVEALRHQVVGYLVADRLVLDTARVDPDPAKIVGVSERVYLIEPGLGRFVRVSAGRVCEDGPLVYRGQEMPLGPEDEVTQAYLNQAKSLENVKGVPPALDASFRMETWRRAEAERRRLELEKQRREEEERLQKEARRQQLLAQLGDGAGRRQMAQQDFGEAARAALAMGGAVYLDHRQAYGRNEMVVTYRYQNRRFECTCDARTLRIIDSGICLTDHNTNERGDTRFTLESLPAVIRQADREGKLVVYRHGGEDFFGEGDPDDD